MFSVRVYLATKTLHRWKIKVFAEQTVMCTVGWAKKKLFWNSKKEFSNPGKSAKNIFQTDFGWLTVTTAVQPRDKGHEKVKFNKIDITFDTLRLQSSFWSQNAQKYQNYICLLRTFFRKPNSICGFWIKLIFNHFLAHLFNIACI